MEHLQHSSPRIPSRKQALFAAALALFSRMPDALAASDDPELETAEAELRAARPSRSEATSLTSRRNVAATTQTSSSSIGITAGSTFSLFSSGDNPVQSPGVFGRVNFQVPGITHRRGSTVEIEGSYADLDQALSDTHATFEPRDSARKLDGDMVNFSAGAGLDVPLASSDTIGANLHIGTHFGASVLYIDGGTDVAVSKKPDSQGRRALANMPSRTVVFPHTSARAEIAIVTRDDISGAVGGYFTLSALPTQNRAGDPDGSHTPFVDSGLRASLGFQF